MNVHSFLHAHSLRHVHGFSHAHQIGAGYDKEVFETMPVPRAVATLAIPTVISQIVTMIYNLGDTFFVGQIGNPGMVAAVTVVSPWFNLLTALATSLASARAA